MKEKEKLGREKVWLRVGFDVLVPVLAFQEDHCKIDCV